MEIDFYDTDTATYSVLGLIDNHKIYIKKFGNPKKIILSLWLFFPASVQTATIVFKVVTWLMIQIRNV